MKKRSAKTIAEDIRSHRDSSAPFHLTFAPTGNLKPEERTALEAHLKKAFLNWWDSWIGPELNEIIEKER